MKHFVLLLVVLMLFWAAQAESGFGSSSSRNSSSSGSSRSGGFSSSSKGWSSGLKSGSSFSAPKSVPSPAPKSGFSSSSGGWSRRPLTPPESLSAPKSGFSSPSKGWSGKQAAPVPQQSLKSLAPPAVSSRDRALYEKAKMQGMAFKTREDARRDFQQRHASEYPTRFSSEPSARPSYVPRSTRVGGQEVVVVYDRGRGGYGSFYGGSWRPYNPLMDYLVLDALLGQRGYAVAPPAALSPVMNPALVVASRGGRGAGATLLGIMLGIVLSGIAVIVLWFLLRRKE